MFRKIKRKIESFGIRDTVFFMAWRLFNTVFRSSNLLFRINLLDYNPHDKPLNTEIEIMEKKIFQEITHSEKKALREYGGVDFLRLFESRLKRGHRLFLASIGGEIAGARWVYIGGDRSFFVIPLSEREFMCFAAFTIDKFRRNGVSTTLFIHILTMMRQEAFQQGFVFTKEWNFHQKTILKAGFQPIGKFYEFRVLKRNILIWASVNDRVLQ